MHAVHRFKVEILTKCEIKIHLVTRLSQFRLLSFFFSLPSTAHSQEAVVMVINANALC